MFLLMGVYYHLCTYKGSSYLIGWHAAVQAQEKATFSWSGTGWTDRVLGLEWLAGNFDKYTKEK